MEELDLGLISGDEFRARLHLLVQQLESCYAQVEAIPTSPQYAEGKELLEHSKGSLQLLYDGVELLGDYVDNRSPEIAGEALALIAEASDYLAQMLAITAQNMEDLNREF